jgi:hypothetical protein
MSIPFIMIFPADSVDERKNTSYPALTELVLAEIYRSRKIAEPSPSCQSALEHLAGDVAGKLVDLFTYSKMDDKVVTTIPMVLTGGGRVTFPQPLYQWGGLEKIFTQIMQHADAQSDIYIETGNGTETLTAMYESMLTLADELGLRYSGYPKALKWKVIQESTQNLVKQIRLEAENAEPHVDHSNTILAMTAAIYQDIETLLGRKGMIPCISTMNKDEAIRLIAREIATLEQTESVMNTIYTWFSSEKNEWLDELFYGWVFHYLDNTVPRFAGFRNYK